MKKSLVKMKCLTSLRCGLREGDQERVGMLISRDDARTICINSDTIDKRLKFTYHASRQPGCRFRTFPSSARVSGAAGVRLCGYCLTMI